MSLEYCIPPVTKNPFSYSLFGTIFPIGNSTSFEDNYSFKNDEFVNEKTIVNRDNLLGFQNGDSEFSLFSSHGIISYSSEYFYNTSILFNDNFSLQMNTNNSNVNQELFEQYNTPPNFDFEKFENRFSNENNPKAVQSSATESPKFNQKTSLHSSDVDSDSQESPDLNQYFNSILNSQIESPMLFYEVEELNHQPRQANSNKLRNKAARLLHSYKVNLCIFYERNLCKNGPDCHFAHGREELRDSGNLQNSKSRKIKAKKKNKA